MSRDRKIKPLDAVWLMMESADTPMHVGVLAIFKIPRAGSADFLPRLAEQMRSARCVAPWNLKLAGRLPRRLVPSDDFDIDYHFRRSALPEPGGERELGRMVSRLHTHALDRDRPLWEFQLIEGLADNRFAFYVKIHHALVEAVNGVPAVIESLSRGARGRNAPPLWARPLLAQGGEDFSDELTLPALDQSVDALVSIGRAAIGLLQGALRTGDQNSFLFPRGTPRSTLNRKINSQRRFATQQFALKRIERLASSTDSTLNEILTYLCGSSLRRFFKEYNALPDEPLVAIMPVSLQERSAHIAGNAITGLRVPLCTHVGDPFARLEAVKAAMKHVREDRASLPDEAVTSYVLMRSAPVYASQLAVLGQFVPPLFNLAVSNTRGCDQPRYFNGARLEAIYPLSPLLQFGALSIDCVQYAGTLNIGFTGARDTLPRLQRLAVYLGRALDDLEELVMSQEAAS